MSPLGGVDGTDPHISWPILNFPDLTPSALFSGRFCPAGAGRLTFDFSTLANVTLTTASISACLIVCDLAPPSLLPSKHSAATI